MLDTDDLNALTQARQNAPTTAAITVGNVPQDNTILPIGDPAKLLPRARASTWSRERRAADRLLSRLLDMRTDSDDVSAVLNVDRDFLRVQIATARQWLKGLATGNLPANLSSHHLTRHPRLWDVSRAMATAVREGATISRIAAQAWHELDPETVELCELPSAFRAALLVEIAERTVVLVANSGPSNPMANYNRLTLLLDTLHTAERLKWASIVESISPIDEIYGLDPTREYSSLPSSTRALYRQATSRMSRAFSVSETQVAREAVRLAVKDHMHLGCVLLGRELGPWLASKVSAPNKGRQFQPLRRAGAYLILQAVSLVLTVLTAYLLTDDLAPPPQWELGLLVLIASISSTWIVNVTYQRLTPARQLASLDFSSGIPQDARTVVAVPLILSGVADIPAAMKKLEELYLCGRDHQLCYLLLTDLKDAAAQDVDDEISVERAIADSVTELNAKYRPCEPFGVLHRRRVWSASQGRWMGLERKRGKLKDLNRYILGDPDTGFSLAAGSAARIHGARYVVTLDSDTVVEQGTVRRLCEIIHHPANRPRIDAKGQDLGYGIVQPTVVTLQAAEQYSWFEGITNPASGIDPYSDTQADLYFNLFDEGSFIGKGIYDVAWVDSRASKHLPSDCILSHDQLEGALARCCVASKVNVFERAPADYREDAERRMRWIRGDWQNLMLLLSRRCLTLGDGERRAHISIPAVWKLVDNARRSLVPVACMALLGAALVRNHPSDWRLLLISLGLAATPSTSRAIRWTWDQAKRRSDAINPAPTSQKIALFILSVGFRLATLPFEFVRVVQEIAATAWRVWVSRRNLLQWQPYGSHVQAAKPHLASQSAFYRYMGTGSVLGITLAVMAMSWVGCAFAVLWATAPWMACILSTKRQRVGQRISRKSRDYLYDLGRRTWSFFEDHVNAQTHWLPPDHVRVDNKDLLELAAVRTSSTNIGLGLLAPVAACDLGYISIAEMVDRLDRSLQSARRLARYRGHLFNWYVLADLKPAEPLYVSTVDSGNFRASVVTLRQALKEFELRADDINQLCRGLASTVRVFVATVDGLAVREVVAIERLTSVLEERAGDSSFLDDILEHLVSLVRAAGAAQRVHGNLIPARWADKVEEAAARIVGIQPGNASCLPQKVADLTSICDELLACDETFGYVREEGLFSIGLSPVHGRLDEACYDMLASEARLGIYLAIANGGVPASAWWNLSRAWSSWRGGSSLLSWSGSMFEYFMPELLLPTIPKSLLAVTLERVVRAQKGYAKRRGLPWGISEAGLCDRDANGDYQYSALGLPALGLQRDLGTRDVVAPYATALALAVDVEGAVANFQALEHLGALGQRGFYESVDFGGNDTGPRIGHVVFEYMAHHQGMSILAMANVLCQRPMQRRFQKDPCVGASTAMLNERVPDWALLAKRSTRPA